MKNLKGVLEEEGFQNVVTYIQSGNLVLSSILQTETEVAAKITEVIKAICELTIDVFVFSEKIISKSSQTIHFRQKQLAKKNAGWLLFIMKILISQDKKRPSRSNRNWPRPLCPCFLQPNPHLKITSFPWSI